MPLNQCRFLWGQTEMSLADVKSLKVSINIWDWILNYCFGSKILCYLGCFSLRDTEEHTFFLIEVSLI